MAEPVLAKKRYTYEDYLKTPDDERYELIEGDLFMTPSPKTEHQRISRELEFKMVKFVKENDLGEVFDAPYDVGEKNQGRVQIFKKDMKMNPTLTLILSLRKRKSLLFPPFQGEG